jgi:hypothetical protein
MFLFPQRETSMAYQAVLTNELEALAIELHHAAERNYQNEPLHFLYLGLTV